MLQWRQEQRTLTHFINGVEAIQETPKLEIILEEAHTGGEMELRYQTGRERNPSCNISNMVLKWSRLQRLKECERRVAKTQTISHPKR